MPAWSAWASGLEGETAWRDWAREPSVPQQPGVPDVPFVPALLRRRCDALARAMLHVVEACCPAGAREEVTSVFASRHGAIATTADLLGALAAGQPVSPNGFSHSVHNTQLGLFSIWAGNRHAGSSVAAGAQTFTHAFVEALGLLHRSPERAVLLVVGDERVPEPLAAAAPGRPGCWAVALRVERGAGVGGLGFEAAAAPGAPAALPDGLEFLRWWLADEAALTLGLGSGGCRFTRLGASPASSP